MDNNLPSKISSDQLVVALLDGGVTLFHDQYKEAYISTDGTGKEVFAVHSQLCQEWLGHHYYVTLGKVASPDTLKKIANTLSGRAIFDSEAEMKELQIRAVWQNSLIWYDLGKSSVLIGANYWSIFDDPAILFRRFQHQKEQVRPVLEADSINLIRQYINLQSEMDYLLFLVYLIAAFIPGFPHPLLVLHGAQGAGKTTPMRILKELIDPSRLQGLPPPQKPEDFVHVASKHYFLFFDNLSSMQGWLSDTLARAVTGDGFSKRKLYSNDDDVVYNLQKTIAINGINQVITRSDLLDRAVLLNLERIPDHKRIEEAVFWERFNKDKAIILGSIFTVLSKAIQIHPSVKLDKKPRMADFYRWGCAITEALGQPKEVFMRAYDANINNQHNEAIEASPVAQAIIKFMKNRDLWEGTATDLVEALNDVSGSNLNAKSAGVPQHSNWLSRNLTLLQPNLLANGIIVERKDNARPRKLILSKDPNFTVGTDVPAGLDVIDNIFGTTEELTDVEIPFGDRQHDSTDGKNLELED